MPSSDAPVLSARRRRPAGACSTPVTPDLDVPHLTALAATAKALGDPTRMQIVDVVRRCAPEAVCQCELVPLFAMSQAGLAKHLRVLVDASVLASERRGAWTFYFPAPGGLEPLGAWLDDAS